MGWQDAPIVKAASTAPVQAAPIATPAPTQQPAWKSAPVLPQADLATRVENQESRHNPNAVNKTSGAVGSMQTLPSTLKDPGYGVTPAKDNTPAELTRVGRDYLAALRKTYGNDTHALAAYNWGPGNVNGLLKKTAGNSAAFIKGLPAETQDYITKITADNSPTPAAPTVGASAGVPAWKAAPVIAAKAPEPEAPAAQAPQPPANGKEWLASISEPATKAGANLISGMIAPFMSQKSLDILQKKGLYTPGESPVHEFSTAAYGTIMAPIAPIVDAVTKKGQQAGEATIGKKKTDMVGGVLGTIMDVLGVAGIPGARAKIAESVKTAIDPKVIEGKMVELEKQHDASTDPKQQQSIKDQMMALANQAADAIKNKAQEAIKNDPKLLEKQMAELEKKHDASKDPAEQQKIKDQMMQLADKATAPKRAYEAAPIVEKSTLSQAGEGLRNVVAPEKAGLKADDTATTIRAETGTANRSTAQAEAKLKQSYEQAASMTPEQHADFYNYVEGRSKGATLADPTLQKIADDTRGVMEKTREDIEALPEGDKIGFVEDYFPHMWKNPESARKFTNDFMAKQGSNRALKARKLPTIADGKAAGLELVDSNPVKAASRYATSMNNYIASKKIATQIIDKGDAKYYAPGKQPEGWVPLTGRFAERTRSYLKDVPGQDDVAAVASHEKLFAPQEVARVYNNFYSKGLESTDLAKPYEIGRSLNAANTAAELSLSAYHLGTITGQLLASDVSRIFKNAAVGDWKGVGKAALSATAGQIPFVKGSAYKLGNKLIKQYKGLEDHGIDMESIAEHFERGGGKVGQEKLYRGGSEGGLITAKGGIKQAAHDIKEEWNQPGLSPKGKAALDVFQRVTEDVSYPLFEKYIPSVKTGSFANLMGDWLRQNPTASEAEIASARKKYIDLVDDRFGEMNMDNVFWHKYMKQAASLFLRAQGWDIGLVRQAGGGVLDTVKILENAFKGKKIPTSLIDRPAFLASVIGTMALTSAAYQYMKTGKAPDEMLDYFAPKTGGKSTRGTPERTLLPTAAHGREIVHIAAPYVSEGAFGTESPMQGLADEVSNKISSFPRNVVQAYENEDYFGNKLGDTTGPNGWMGSIPSRVGHVAEGFMPFGLTPQGEKNVGSNLNGIERRLLGMRPAGMEISDPENFKQMRWTQELRKEAKEHKAAARREGQKEK